MAPPTTRRESRRAAAGTGAATPAPIAPPRLGLLALTLLLGAAGLSGADAKAAVAAAPPAAVPSTMELVDAGGKLASASEITSLLR